MRIASSPFFMLSCFILSFEHDFDMLSCDMLSWDIAPCFASFDIASFDIAPLACANAAVPVARNAAAIAAIASFFMIDSVCVLPLFNRRCRVLSEAAAARHRASDDAHQLPPNQLYP